MDGIIKTKNRFSWAAVMVFCLAILLALPVLAGADEGAVPTVLSGEVTNKGDISITFDQAMANPAGTQGQFTVTADGVEITVEKVEKTNTPGKIKLVMVAKVSETQKIVVTYTKSDEEGLQVKSEEELAVESFVLQFGPPAALAAEVTKQGDISITFDQAMADPSGTQEQFAVTVDEAEVLIEKVENTNTPSKIKLVLETKAAAEQLITVSYTKGSDPAAQIKSDSGTAVESFELQIGEPLVPPVLAADTSDNKVGKNIDITFAADAEWSSKITNIKVNDESIRGKYTIGDGNISIMAEVFPKVGSYTIEVRATAYENAVVTQEIKSSSTGGSTPGDGSGTGDGSGDGTGTPGGLTVEFTAIKTNPGSTALHLDFSNGMDRNLETSLGLIQVYEKLTSQAVVWSDYVYDKSGNTATGDKVRRLILKFNNLKAGTTYVVELGPGVMANNGSTLGVTKKFEFTTAVSTTSGGGTANADNSQTTEPVAEPDPQPETPAEEPAAKLNDIADHWAKENIEKLVALDAISGYPDGSFAPEKGISRAEFALVLVKAFKLEAKTGKTFADTAGHWAEEAIATAYGHGIISGYDEDTFGPDDPVTREQMTVMIFKAAKLTAGTDEIRFADSEQISDWAAAAVAAAVNNQLISGYPDNTFRPAQGATRAEAVTVILKAS